MIVKLMGGPAHETETEIEDGPITVLAYRCDRPAEIGLSETDFIRVRPLGIVLYRAVAGWTTEGARYFVAPDWKGSLIGDEEIEVAARWLAEQAGEAMDIESRSLPVAIFNLQDTFRRSLRRWRDAPGCPAPDAPIMRTHKVKDGPEFLVEITPGRVTGHKLGDPLPIFRWPPHWAATFQTTPPQPPAPEPPTTEPEESWRDRPPML